MYAAEHEMSLQMEGLTKPRKKRGRPPKVHAEADVSVRNFNYFVTLCDFYDLYLNAYVITVNKRESRGNYEPR